MCLRVFCPSRRRHTSGALVTGVQTLCSSDLVKGSVLAGYSAFSIEDARDAGRRLLHEGPVRIKPVRATGGRGWQRADAADTVDERTEARRLGKECVRAGSSRRMTSHYRTPQYSDLSHTTTGITYT